MNTVDAITNIDEKGNRYTANISKLSSETYIFLGDEVPLDL